MWLRLFPSIFLCIFHLFIPKIALAQKFVTDNRFQKVVNNFAEDTALFTASVGIGIIDLQTGNIVASYNPNKALIPASSLKIFSTAALISEVGAEYQYRTDFILEGKTNFEGEFNGRLQIEPSIDPSFCSPDQFGALTFENLADTLAGLLMKSGIKKIRGQITVNRDLITDIPENSEWLWYDLGNYYGAGCYSLNFMENAVKIYLQEQTRSGKICDIVKVIPSILEDNYCSEVRSSVYKSDESLFVLGSSQDDIYTVHGDILCCGRDTVGLKAAMRQPESVFVRMLISALKKRGIQVIQDKVVDTPDDVEVLIYQYISPSLWAIADRALKKSVNLYCESFLHTFGMKKNQTSKRKDALIALSQFWGSAGIDTRGLNFEDGSGLSPKNSATPLQLAQSLLWTNQNEKTRYFYKLLPDVANEGTLAGEMNKYRLSKGKLRLKSGSMERVRSYCGYLMNNDKPTHAVALIVNNYSCSSDTVRKKIGSLMSGLLKYN